jgi:hypothetical protein
VTQGTHKLTDNQYPQYPGTITFTLNGNVIYSSRLNDSPASSSFTYKPTSDGNGVIRVTVTDSVLYSATQNVSINYTAMQNLSIVSR